MGQSNHPDTSKWPKGATETHSRAEALDIQGVKRFLAGLGYSVVALEQRWRHVHGILEGDKHSFFFKLASTPEIGVKTKSEVAWNVAVADELLELSKGRIIVPRIHRTGVYNANFFYIADYYAGEFPADHDPPRTETLGRSLSSLVEIALSLNRLSNDTLWGDEGPSNNESLTERFCSEVDRWQQGAQRADLQELRALVDTIRQAYRPRLSHGDFVPWHVILYGEKRVLIDGEHAWSGRPQYYDVAYFYHRLATSGARPDLARRFLGEFREGLPKAEQSVFRERFLPLIAARAIAGFYDATIFDDQRKLIDMHERVKEMILSDDLF